MYLKKKKVCFVIQASVQTRREEVEESRRSVVDIIAVKSGEEKEVEIEDLCIYS